MTRLASPLSCRSNCFAKASKRSQPRKFATRSNAVHTTPLDDDDERPFCVKKLPGRNRRTPRPTAGTPETDAHNPPDNAHAPLTANAHERRSPAALSPHAPLAQSRIGAVGRPRSQRMP